MATLTTHEQQEIDRANASGLQPVVFVHGLWLLSSSWDNWRQLFEASGYTTLAPGWPDDPETVAEANEDPEVFAHKRLRQITGHYLEAIGQLTKKPAVVGHSFGGLISMMIAGQGVAAVTVAISPAPFRGVLPLPFSALKSSSAVLANPANYNRAVALTYEQFHYGFTNAVDEDEAHKLYDAYAAPGAGAPVFQAATANVNPWTEDQVDTSNPERGPLLIISSDQDHTVPFAIADAAYKRQVKNPGITEIKEMSNRGHSLTIDHGWREVAETALAFVTEHTPKDQ
ncbi:MAG TPA: alpha/beta hydrolase [Ktedonobacterales bacterium]|nr:alpha/beta hydrolase [Ktedonobacterales bacterium]